jgi:hypothetical protein
VNEISFLFDLTPDGRHRIRVRAFKESGQILSFVVQYESEINETWIPIVRYDTAHSFAHRDILHPDGTQSKQALFFVTLNEAFNFAINDLKLSWEAYLRNYLSEIKK